MDSEADPPTALRAVGAALCAAPEDRSNMPMLQQRKQTTNSEVEAENLNCPTLTVEHGVVRLNQGGTIAYFYCDESYAACGAEVAFCKLDGQWFVLPSDCICKNIQT